MSKPKKPKPKDKNPDKLRVVADADDEAVMKARTILRPTVNGGITIKTLLAKELPDADLTALVDELAKQGVRANDGDLARMEAMMAVQAHTLDALFNKLTRRAENTDYLSQFDTYMKFALRTQSQCRATVETLSEMKNPKPVAFVRQANIANGPQQVNNGTQEPSRAKENQNQPNKLLEEMPHERLDFGTKSTTGGINSSLEAVGKVNGTDDG